MLKRILIIFAALAATISLSAQYRPGAAYSDIDDGETVSCMKNHVRYLASAMMEGRKAGSEGEKAAADYVASTFKEYGVDLLTPAGGELFGIKTEQGDTLTSRNVIGFVQGYDPVLRNQYIVVGARLDNMGSMTMTVDGKPVERVYYGANGNASGLAILVELARMVQTHSILFRRSVLFIAFGASSQTFAGSWYFLNRSFSDVDKIDAMINLDMLGTGDRGFYAYTSSNADMNTLLNMMKGQLQPVHPELTSSEPYPSDHRAFYAKEIPSVFFTTGKYPEHNTYRDTPSVVNYEMMERELEYIYNFTRELANTDMQPLFRDMADKNKTSDDVVAYYDCDQRPMFLNSQDPRRFLEEWVYKYLKYPESALRNGIQGRVMVQFIIEKNGKVTDVKVVRGVSEELDAEAVKVISASPEWKAGRVNGNKVRTSMSIPVEFRLEKKGGKPSFGIKK